MGEGKCTFRSHQTKQQYTTAEKKEPVCEPSAEEDAASGPVAPVAEEEDIRDDQESIKKRKMEEVEEEETLDKEESVHHLRRSKRQRKTLEAETTYLASSGEVIKRKRSLSYLFHSLSGK